MSLKTKAYSCAAPGEALALQEIELPPLESHEVTLKMEASGLCHTDVHMVKNDWGISDFPLVPGHEGVGIVTELGAHVKGLQVGDRCGVGWIRSACGQCKRCSVGRENLCAKGYQGTYLSSSAGVWGKQPNNQFGCFAQHMRIDAKFAFKIPNGLEGPSVPPLLCGGTTVFEPIVDYVRPGMAVGVIGCGGLGHLAIKFANAFGADVTAISRHIDKESKVKEMGAMTFVHTKNEAAMTEAAGSLDVIIDTTPVSLDIERFAGLLAFGGVYCKVGIPPADDQTFSFKYIPLVFTGRVVCAGSIVCGSARTAQMLQLCARRGITADVESVSFAKINEVMAQLQDEKNTKMRFTLVWE